MSAPRQGTVLADIQAEFERLAAGSGHFEFVLFVASNLRALAGSMGPRFPRTREAQEMALLGVLRGKEKL